MKISQTQLFYVNAYSVNCELEIFDGLNILTGRNGIGKTTFFDYIKNHAKELFPNKVCAFMDQFPLKPLIELRGIDILQILEEDISRFKPDKANELIDLFNFRKLLDACVENYSGGENQIFKFILMMGQQADIYFLDEPLQYLDDKNIEKLMSEIYQLSDKKIVMIEHRLEKLLDLNCHWIEMKEWNQNIIISAKESDGRV